MSRPEAYLNPLFRTSALIIVMVLTLSTLGMGTRPAGLDKPLSINALHAHCGLPLKCGAPAAWQGETVTVQGRLDPDNRYDRKRHPRLPYEKFLLVGEQGALLEVWPTGPDNDPIFDKLAHRTTDRVIVRGQLAAFSMPVSGDCRMGVKVMILHADQIQFPSR
ncbi:MAG: hypothetical protein HKP58_16730 [Desulfatitalea sp.]|nr:hypothetical protein [Desulfatitalea sp.]NNK02060.1 hypothetical protein [Desulfatitalea sp.]